MPSVVNACVPGTLPFEPAENPLFCLIPNYCDTNADCCWEIVHRMLSLGSRAPSVPE